MIAWLASTALRDLDATVAGVHFGPIDTLFMIAGLLVVLIGLAAARSIAHPREPQKSASDGSSGSGTR